MDFRHVILRGSGFRGTWERLIKNPRATRWNSLNKLLLVEGVELSFTIFFDFTMRLTTQEQEYSPR